jgi:hypothetical protein
VEAARNVEHFEKRGIVARSVVVVAAAAVAVE